MKIQPVQSLSELQGKIKKEKRSFLIIWKKGSGQSETAFSHFSEAAAHIDDIGLFSADVGRVRDIHPHYRITSAPVVLEFNGTEYRNAFKGAHDPSYYRNLFENAVFVAKAEKEGRKIKQVTVYSTPTCSWCNTLKSYLNQHQVRYTEIDVSRNDSAAQEMVGRSGQQGVPQTLVNGETVIGFDKSKLNRLLEIQGN